MAKRKFHMKQADLRGKSWVGLSFQSYLAEEENSAPLTDPFIARFCGDEIDYGRLFAYCFRRFGYPDRGWDDYKELVAYYLSTPHPDLVLKITPFVGNSSFISVCFIVEKATIYAIEAYAQRDRLAWEQRSFDWAESQGLPDWMPEWLVVFNTEYRAAFPKVPVAENWRQSVGFQFALGEKGSRVYEVTHRVSEFRKNLHEAYSRVEQYPPYYDRPSELQAWNEDDPLKPLALAATAALEDLRTPVGVRDQSIDAFGIAESGRSNIKVAKSAGYPSGSLGNTAPHELAELHALALKLGNGNAKRGIKKILAATDKA